MTTAARWPAYGDDAVMAFRRAELLSRCTTQSRGAFPACGKSAAADQPWSSLVIDGEDTHQAQDSQQDNGRGDGLLRARVHLLAADGLLSEESFHSLRVYLTLCGVAMTDLELPHATCPEECDCELYYCPQCIRWATGWNAEMDQDAASGVAR